MLQKIFWLFFSFFGGFLSDPMSACNELDEYVFDSEAHTVSLSSGNMESM